MRFSLTVPGVDRPEPRGPLFYGTLCWGRSLKYKQYINELFEAEAVQQHRRSYNVELRIVFQTRKLVSGKDHSVIPALLIVRYNNISILEHVTERDVID